MSFLELGFGIPLAYYQAHDFENIAACAAVIYGLHWSKPKSVGATTTIMQFEGPIPEEMLQLIKGRDTNIGYLLIAHDSRKLKHGSPIRNDATANYVDKDAGFLGLLCYDIRCHAFWRNPRWGMEFRFPHED
jgi:hypothetical protein